ncbi:hypothetical protein ACJMK2_000454 [Sinanodonta woodiana]|uniref:C-type lectin domain-containing protein n=1 Tax=Sinanodonta woodiana TaxID=1069815 RepID=A0ABD3XPU1_SINWO
MFIILRMKSVFYFFSSMTLFIGNSLSVDVLQSSCSTWEQDLDSVNNLDPSVPLWERNDCPFIDCAILCDRDPSCKSFFHFSSLEKCLASSSFKRGLPTDKAGQQGWIYFTKKQHCGEGYIFNQSLGLCYKLYSISQSFNNAMITCEKDGAKLMTIRNEAEFRFIQNVTKGAITFIGLRAMGVNREWKWWNGQLASYITWNRNQPDNWNGLENCVVLYTQYADVYCSSLGYFICQKFI